MDPQILIKGNITMKNSDLVPSVDFLMDRKLPSAFRDEFCILGKSVFLYCPFCESRVDIAKSNYVDIQHRHGYRLVVECHCCEHWYLLDNKETLLGNTKNLLTQDSAGRIADLQETKQHQTKTLHEALVGTNSVIRKILKLQGREFELEQILEAYACGNLSMSDSEAREYSEALSCVQDELMSLAVGKLDTDVPF